MTGLALALLAVTGFITPASAPRRAQVVQCAEKTKASPLACDVVFSAAIAETPHVAKHCTASSEHHPQDSRRYLFNHAWLI